MDKDAKFCPKCGAMNENVGEEEKKESVLVAAKLSEPMIEKLKKHKKVVIIGIAILIVVIVGVVFLLKPGKSQRAKTLMNLDQDSHLKFTLNGEDFYLGDTALTYQQKNYTYEDDYLTEEDTIAKDSISVHSFYHDDKEQFLGALYCAKNEDCKYEDSILIKANFYEDSNVIIDDYIQFGMKYQDIVDKYGKEDGKFYQGSNLLVWTFGEKGKIGEPYYVLRFDDSGLFATGKLIDIRIGVWWYNGEYEQVVVK